MPAGASGARRSASICSCTTIPSEAARLAAELDRLNRERQAIELATVAQAEAEAMAALGLEEKGAVVVTAAEGWHPGVVGLVAARLKERYGRPAFAIALEPGGIGTGSGRSIPGVDLGRVVRQAVSEGLLIKGGGHAMAAGVTLRKDALAAFRAYLEDALGAAVEAMRREDALLIDGALSAAGATMPRRWRASRARARSAPATRSRSSRCPRIRSSTPTRSARPMCGRGCARATAPSSMRSHSAPPGRSSVTRWRKTAGSRCTRPARSRVDRWNGTERVQLRLIDIAPADAGLRLQ